MKKLTLSVSALFLLGSGSIKAQSWKTIIKEDFGYQTTFNTRSSNPAVDLKPGESVYELITGTSSFSDGKAFIGSSSLAPAISSGAYIIQQPDHTPDSENPTGTYGNMFTINANPGRQGEATGSYYLYNTSLDTPGAQYRFSFYGASVVRKSFGGKPGMIGLTVRDVPNTGTQYNSTSDKWSLTSNSDTTLNWQLLSSSFSLPITYSGSQLYFNFYNTDTTAGTTGNDLTIDDILIEILVVQLSGKVFIDYNGNGIQDAVDANANGTTIPLYVYVTNKNNKIISKTQVKADGTYILDTTSGVPFASSDIGLKLIVSSTNINVDQGVTLTSSTLKDKIIISENVATSNHPTYFTTNAVDGVINLTKSDVDLTNVNFGIHPQCYRAGATSPTANIKSTEVGVSSINRGSNIGGTEWPLVRKGGWIALESNTKGFVVNRLTDAQITALPASNLVEGMLIYNMTKDCLQINTDGTSTGWKCYNIQTCPE